MPKINWYKSCSYDDTQKRLFHKVAKQRLKALADALNLEPGSYDLRVNKAGVAVSGEITLHSDCLYVQVCQPCTSDEGVMFRTCNGRKDYTGGRNHFAPTDMLDDIEVLAVRCRNILSKT